MRNRWQADRGVRISAAVGAAAVVLAVVVTATTYLEQWERGRLGNGVSAVGTAAAMGARAAPPVVAEAPASPAVGVTVAAGFFLALLAVVLMLRKRRRGPAPDRRDELGAALEQQRADFETISRRAVHDLRNPLNTVGLNVHLLRTALAREDPALAGAAIEHIERAKQQMVGIVDALRAVSRASFGNLSLATVDMTAEARAAGALLRASDPRLERVELDVSDLPGCVADPQLARVLLKNLLEHVIASTGGDPPRLEVGFDPDQGSGQYYVRDASAELIPARRDELFEQRPTGGTAGSTTGLQVAARIVAGHGGRLWASNRADSGHVVRFSLAPSGGAGVTDGVADETTDPAAIRSDRAAIRAGPRPRSGRIRESDREN